MKCYECKWLDRSVILTSNPPQYGCTLGFGSHYADHECEYDFMPIVRCKDCEYYNKGENEKESWEECKRTLKSTTPNDFCSWAKMKGGGE